MKALISRHFLESGILRYRVLVCLEKLEMIEIYRAINDMDPQFMSDISKCVIENYNNWSSKSITYSLN